jgi:DNA-binding Lrp family transcriptional regulator
MEIDITNHRILALLTRNARISATEIARQVNLSRPAVQERIATMEANGIINGYRTEIASSAGMTRAVILVKIASRPCGPALEWLQSLEGVTSVISLSGDIDALVHVIMPNLGALSALNDTLAASPLISSATSSVVLSAS